jgi:hypothetical protein
MAALRSRTISSSEIGTARVTACRFRNLSNFPGNRQSSTIAPTCARIIAGGEWLNFPTRTAHDRFGANDPKINR